MLRAAAQTIGEVVIGKDFRMLDSTETDIAEIFKKINQGLHLSQELARKVHTPCFCSIFFSSERN